MTPYKGIKHALAEAASYSDRLGYPSSGSTVRCPSCDGQPQASTCRRCHGEGSIDRPRAEPRDGDAERWPHAVRACLVLAGIELDSDDARLLFAWARSADSPTSAELLATAEEFPAASPESRHLREVAARARRAEELRDLVHPVLVENEVIRKPKRLRVMPIAHIVTEDPEGRREVRVVTDPPPPAEDEPYYRGVDGRVRAQAVADRIREGPVVDEINPWIGGRPPRRPELRAEWLEKWTSAEYSCLVDFDAALAEAAKVTIRWAGVIRQSWGITGSRGRAPTTSEVQT